ncbi:MULTISPECIES: hypothetical protein [unclassified Sphingomonas]|jgi:hypothetical protein|uniref:hypothetical protein n=1 Tax=unclassified Sphingomonas TaxID=196159 RepID=UPI000E10A4EC|nr:MULTISPECIES: hypothetical protein [unclassified Sphingomonas]AXJ95111.1 hypothetical protein DM480_05910 [Sphingomonas sp. FARSPH]
MDEADTRAARLAANLRANLHRRKAQARDLRGGAASPVRDERPDGGQAAGRDIGDARPGGE